VREDESGDNIKMMNCHV